MNRGGTFPSASLTCQGLPGLCNLSVSTSFCEADSIKIKPVAGGESDRGQFDFGDWLFSLFFSARVTACLATCSGEGVSCVHLGCSIGDEPFWKLCVNTLHTLIDDATLCVLPTCVFVQQTMHVFLCVPKCILAVMYLCVCVSVCICVCLHVSTSTNGQS